MSELIDDSARFALENLRKEIKKGEKASDEAVAEAVKVAAKRAILRNFEKKPEIKVHAILFKG